MAELASRFAPGGSVGDTFDGKTIVRVINAPTGEYVRIDSALALQSLSADLGQTAVSSTGDGGNYAMPITELATYEKQTGTAPLALGATGNGVDIASDSGVVPIYTPPLDVTVSSVDVTIGSTAGSAADRTFHIYSGGPAGTLEASSANFVSIPASATTTSNVTFTPPVALTAGTTYYFGLDAPIPQVSFQQLPNALNEIGFSDGNLGDPAVVINGDEAVIGQVNVVTYSDGTVTRVLASDVGNPTDIQDVTAGIPAAWTPVESVGVGAGGAVERWKGVHADITALNLAVAATAGDLAIIATPGVYAPGPNEKLWLWNATLPTPAYQELDSTDANRSYVIIDPPYPATPTAGGLTQVTPIVNVYARGEPVYQSFFDVNSWLAGTTPVTQLAELEPLPGVGVAGTIYWFQDSQEITAPGTQVVHFDGTDWI